ncbi:GAF domain-containing protein [Paenibacillus selenitireducens]|uniref:GAF domain-containing protein n=1 Tax=Paenibacillus selenitireducens TaxID=1324314 RepID=A0A1T2X964_9BACL|nr:GAF domain-containing protein [Paenibacillus selenitireducens]OPA76133.1 GAF domain-containing protein [Paenibacillus selenitireducens]
MFEKTSVSGNPEVDYPMAIRQLTALLEDESNTIANLSNASALLNEYMGDINWVGFYLYEEETDQLVLGPFQGLPACVRIPLGRGVCGTAAAERRTVLVEDVHQFPGHIACDAASRSEIVIPLIQGDRLLGVLDIDSPLERRFNEVDRQYLEQFAAELLRHLN